MRIRFDQDWADDKAEVLAKLAERGYNIVDMSAEDITPKHYKRFIRDTDGKKLIEEDVLITEFIPWKSVEDFELIEPYLAVWE